MFQIRYKGRDFEIKPKDFDLSMKAPDAEVFRRVADWLGVAESALDGYTIERAAGRVSVRPPAFSGAPRR